jgi:hypothetical protein
MYRRRSFRYSKMHQIWVISVLAVIRPEREFGWVQPRQHGMSGTFLYQLL